MDIDLFKEISERLGDGPGHFEYNCGKEITSKVDDKTTVVFGPQISFDIKKTNPDTYLISFAKPYPRASVLGGCLKVPIINAEIGRTVSYATIQKYGRYKIEISHTKVGDGVGEDLDGTVGEVLG